MLLTLSQYMTALWSTYNPKSGGLHTQDTPHAVTTSPLDLACVLNKAILGCFLFLHVTTTLLEENMKQLIYLMSNILAVAAKSIFL